MIELKKLSKSFQGQKVLNELSYSFPDQGLFYLKGQNQAGKTTLFYILSFLDTDYDGKYLFDGTDVNQFSSEERMRVAKKVQLILSHSNVLPHFSLKANLRFDVDKNFPSAKYGDQLNQLGNTLSGGEEIMFVLEKEKYANHSLILLDEVTSSLSDENFRKVMEIIQQLASSHLILMNGHDARMESVMPHLTLREGKIYD